MTKKKTEKVVQAAQPRIIQPGYYLLTTLEDVLHDDTHLFANAILKDYLRAEHINEHTLIHSRNLISFLNSTHIRSDKRELILRMIKNNLGTPDYSATDPKTLEIQVRSDSMSAGIQHVTLPEMLRRDSANEKKILPSPKGYLLPEDAKDYLQNRYIFSNRGTLNTILSHAKRDQIGGSVYYYVKSLDAVATQYATPKQSLAPTVRIPSIETPPDEKDQKGLKEP